MAAKKKTAKKTKAKERPIRSLADLFNALDAGGFTVHTRYGVWDRKRQALKAAKATAKKTAKKSAKRRG